MTRSSALPPNLAPRLICRAAAAEYVGVSPNTFDLMRVDGHMPPPRRLTIGRHAWDVRHLDSAIDCLPIEGAVEPADDAESDKAAQEKLDAIREARKAAKAKKLVSEH
jgi:predicted DNA-binding transcriptional regulator AlpA